MKKFFAQVAATVLATFTMALAMGVLYAIYEYTEHRDARGVIENHKVSADTCSEQKCSQVVLHLRNQDGQKTVVKLTYDAAFAQLRSSEQLYVQDYWSDTYHDAGWETVRAEIRPL